MSVGSSVSLTWGIQIETTPLLLALGAYEASEPARLFFSLLRLRVRSSTLVFEYFSTSTRRVTGTIASLPIEIVDEVLVYLHLKLRRTARRDLIDKIGKCFCRETKSVYGHGCGIDCSTWWTCCGLNDYDWEEDAFPDWNQDRITKMAGELRTVLVPKISNLTSIFNLEVVASPRISDGWRDGRGELSPVLVGVPFPSSTTIHSQGILSNPVSELEPDPDEGTYEVSSVTSVGGSLRLTRRERRRFKRFARALHLEENPVNDDDDEPKVASTASSLELAPISTESKDQEKRQGGRCDMNRWLKGGETSLEPKRMLVHASWGEFD